MNVNEIKKTYPKSHKVLLEFIKKYLDGFQKSMVGQVGVDTEFPEVDDAIAEQATQALITLYKRMLYDFFDENEVYISLEYIGDENLSENYWCSTINAEEDRNYFGDNRIEAEELGFERAFKTLEDKL